MLGKLSAIVVLSLLLTSALPTTAAIIGQPMPKNDQSAMSVITVNTTVDGINSDGACSLREAIRATNLNSAVDSCFADSATDKIILPAGIYTLTVAGGGEQLGLTGDLDPSGPLTVIGAGPQSTVIDGGGIDRVFDIAASQAVTLSHLTIRNGHAPSANGGGINSFGRLTVIDGVIRNNLADGNGGAIANEQGNLVVLSSTLAMNIANTGGAIVNYDASAILTGLVITGNSTAAYGGGGGLRNAIGVLTVTSSLIFSNTASPTAGGGAIVDENGGELYLESSQLISNTAGGGGALYITGDAGPVRIIGSTISNNTANDSGGIFADGVSLVLFDSTVSGNKSVATNGNANGAGLVSSGPVVVSNTTFSGNVAVDLGGAIYHNAPENISLTNVTVVSNSASSGGGIYLNTGTFSLANSLLAGNLVGGNCGNQTVTSNGHNLDSGNTCGFTATGDLTITTPLLGPLQDNGGPTLTHALLSGSPGLNIADPALCPALDQRGFTRTPPCDIGAFEYLPYAQFSAPAYTAPESGGVAMITVTLSYPPAITTSVKFATSNGTASAGSDYIAGSGTITFGVGVTQYSTPITLLDDLIDEPNETVLFALSAPQYAAVKNLIVSTLTVLDDDTPSTTAALFLPLVIRSFGPFEAEPNNSLAQANGPLASGFDYHGYQNDASDYFSFFTAGGSISVDLNNTSAPGTQLYLYYQDNSHLVGHDGHIGGPPYRIDYSGAAGWYYARITAGAPFNSSTQYTLRVTYP